MSDRTESQIQIVTPNFLQQFVGTTDKSLEKLKAYRTVGRLAIVQAMSAGPVKAKHGEASCIIMPEDTLLIKKEGFFDFAPLFFCTEFIKWRDRDDKSGDAIIERTYNQESEIAKLSRDEKKRKEPYAGGPPGKPYNYSYCEHLNFLGTIYGTGAITPVAISFSRGEFRTGRSFSSKIFGRLIPGSSDTCPLWAQVWRFGIEAHKSKKTGHEWWGFSIGNPEQPFIKDVEFEAFQALHKEFEAAYLKNAIGVDMTGDSEISAEDNVVDTGAM